MSSYLGIILFAGNWRVSVATPDGWRQRFLLGPCVGAIPYVKNYIVWVATTRYYRRWFLVGPATLGCCCMWAPFFMSYIISRQGVLLTIGMNGSSWINHFRVFRVWASLFLSKIISLHSLIRSPKGNVSLPDQPFWGVFPCGHHPARYKKLVGSGQY